MPILNKTALTLSTLIGPDKRLPMLANIHVTEDGDVVACNRRSVMVIEGVSEERALSIPFEGEGQEVKGAFTLPLDLVDKVLKGIPADKQFDGLLELLHVKEEEEGGTLIITSHDGKGEKTLKGLRSEAEFVDYSSILKKLYYDAPKSNRFILERKALIQTLQTMDKICEDAPSYIEVTEKGDLFIRSASKVTGQQVLGVITGVIGEWRELSPFDRKFGGNTKIEPTKKRVKPLRKKRMKKKDS